MLPWKHIKLSALAAVLSVTAASAAPIFQNNAVVVAATHSADFDAINHEQSLDGYASASGLSVSVPDIAYGVSSFAGTHYGSGGNYNWVTINLVGGGGMASLDFRVGDGLNSFTGAPTNLIWETFAGGASTGFGDVSVSTGSTVGWSDTDSFTSLRVAAHTYNTISFGDYQAIQLDDLRVSAASAPVPEPSTYAMFGASIFLLALRGYRSRTRNC
ncbi:MAG: hypothetical protein ACJAT5_001002 [Lentimonas sp.]|jgi:hypothetical protein